MCLFRKKGVHDSLSSCYLAIQMLVANLVSYSLCYIIVSFLIVYNTFYSYFLDKLSVASFLCYKCEKQKHHVRRTSTKHLPSYTIIHININLSLNKKIILQMLSKSTKHFQYYIFSSENIKVDILFNSQQQQHQQLMIQIN